MPEWHVRVCGDAWEVRREMREHVEAGGIARLAHREVEMPDKVIKFFTVDELNPGGHPAYGMELAGWSMSDYAERRGLSPRAVELLQTRVRLRPGGVQ